MFSRNGASFAVALNCGIGSSSLNADVNAFPKLQRVLGANSSIVGLKYRSCTRVRDISGLRDLPQRKRGKLRASQFRPLYDSPSILRLLAASARSSFACGLH